MVDSRLFVRLHRAVVLLSTAQIQLAGELRPLPASTSHPTFPAPRGGLMAPSPEKKRWLSLAFIMWEISGNWGPLHVISLCFVRVRPFFRIDADSWGLADVYNIHRLSAVLFVVVVGSLSPSGFIKRMGGPMDKLLTQLASGCLLHTVVDSLFHVLVDFLFLFRLSPLITLFPPSSFL
ncbi:hypothetical protein BDW42DRAFT_134505 [Aspergillus taichungensis]|uniref:Uncharacterized protein n=1 Tax=Aspergillus taichungensis TaxID=482145 RepID=A0A2J5HPK0_9EURO|nr:hypothetical protein BDW42DRAFT_134505 [Aspergillus taichungensis]